MRWISWKGASCRETACPASNSNEDRSKAQGSLTDESLIDPVRLKKSACRWEASISPTWDISIGEGLLLDERLVVTRSLVPKPEPTTGRRKATRWNWRRCSHSK